ncbi:hypothetical protein PTTG_09667 [Puccinia triticina 1-1 BBBD Race 1]|uniref:Uncharacterized protein n=1 Tax=Puccinia triticina (isolate 1-1 / race 1 (BBBD)) TaxID=630390 RepID=A0A180GNR7_PUCT1|nr:hypothetical protein PTTG_09667 [Puccinia triticina 1-1 BBBD Race 1]
MCHPADPATITTPASTRSTDGKISIGIEYELFVRVQKNGQSKSKMKRMSSKGRVVPMELNLDKLDFSLLKTLVIQHLENINVRIYPIEIIAAQADRASALKWSYIILEPGEFDRDTSTLAEDNGLFKSFVNAAHKSSKDAEIYLILNMEKDNLAIVTVVVSDLPRKPAGGAAVSFNLNAISNKRASADHSANRPPPPKRQNPGLRPLGLTASLFTPPFSMSQFLSLCHIPDDYKPVQAMISDHDIFHWTAFEGTSHRELRKLGLKWGPAQAILKGVMIAWAICDAQQTQS